MNSKPSHDQERVARFLEQRAATQRFDTAPIFYNDLASQLDFPPVDQFWFTHPLCGIFDQLDCEDVAQKHPVRTALVVSKERGLPGEGFFKTVARLRGRSQPPKDFVQQIRLWTNELTQLLAFYQQPLAARSAQPSASH